jgi:alanyl-tRNA synthetase
MPLPTSDTTVTYPDGAIRSTGTVLHVEPLVDGSSAVILDTTAFHPVDTAWPDQPADRGTLTMSRGTLPIVDGVTGGIHAGVLHLGSDLPVRSGTEGWIFVVAHIVEGEPPAVGESVRIDVDAEYRAALSAAHTACHLASLALDAALAEAWTKSVSTDALGNPAFDALAIQRSQIHPLGSTDTYRIGKSLRRRGFTLDALDDPTAVAARIDAQLDRWISAGGPVRIERDDEGISSRRTWVCELPEGRTGIWCAPRAARPRHHDARHRRRRRRCRARHGVEGDSALSGCAPVGVSAPSPAMSESRSMSAAPSNCELYSR